MAKKRRIGILTGGGDVPGLNVAIKAVVMRAHAHDVEVVGLRRGWASLLNLNPDDSSTNDKWLMPLTPERVRTIDRTGGTILHTSRTNPGNMKPADVPAHIRKEHQKANDNGTIDCTGHSLRVLQWLELETLIPIGGDDTLSYGGRLSREGIQVVAIPKTMDNDVAGTDYCIGFSTAITRSVEAITAFRSTVGSHERVGVVELFGRNSGETSLFTAYLADVDRALIPEVPFEVERVCGFLKGDRAKNPSNYAIVTVSEGAVPVGGGVMETGEADAYGHRKLGGIGQFLADEVKTRNKVNVMLLQLAYIMRSGAPDSLDHMVGLAFGNLAFDEALAGNTGKMVALQKGIYTTIPLDIVTSGHKRADVAELYDTQNYKPRVRSMMGKPMFLS